MISRTDHPNYDRELCERAIEKTRTQPPPAALLHDLDRLCGDDRCWCAGPAPLAAEATRPV